MSKKQTVSQQTIDDALKIAKGTARRGQSKEQTKQIAQGIEKGIAEFKKREKAKARERDKAKKKAPAPSDTPTVQPDSVPVATGTFISRIFPWLLLVLSWSGFVLYLLLS